MLHSRRGRWALTVAIAAVVFGLLALAFGRSGEDDQPPRTRMAVPPVVDIKPPKPTRPLSDAAAIERVRRRSPWLVRGSSKGRLIALTFDDGPGPITASLLAELKRLGVPATFFQVGQQAQGNPSLAREESARPFAFGSHTTSHARLSELGPDAQRREIVGGAATVGGATGHRPRLFRPPYGAYDDATLRVLRRERALMVLWTYSAYDWKHPDADYIARRVLRLARPGAIVLMHDAGGVTRVPTLQALPRIVHGLRRKGYRLVTVPRLLRDAPPEHRSPRPRSPYPG